MKVNKGKIKLGVWSAIGGAILTMIIGFAFGGWVTGGTARTRTNQVAGEAVIDHLAPICVVQFNQGQDKEEKLKALKETSSWSRDDYVEKGGWATMPGSETPVTGVAAQCAELLLKTS